MTVTSIARELDADEIFGRHHEPDVAIPGADGPSIATGVKSFTAALSDMRATVLREQHVPRLKTGFPTLDRTMRGIQPGEVLAILGRPGCLKTQISLTVIDSMLTQRPAGAFLLANLEMPASQLVMRQARMHFQKTEKAIEDALRRDALDVADFAEAHRNLFIVDRGAVSLEQVEMAFTDTARLIHPMPIDAVAIDHCGLIRSSRGSSAYERASETGLDDLIARATRARWSPTVLLEALAQAELEARTVQRIFALCAGGKGYSAIAKTLNAERAACPRPQQERPAGWSPSTVRDVLHRELYLGVLLWNRTKKRDRSGDIAPRDRDQSEWVRVQRQDLRIVSDDEWNAAHARIQRARDLQVAPVIDRLVRGRDRESRYLLAGFARCSSCGGTLSVLTRQHGKRRVALYGCLAYHKRGPNVCGNSLVLPVTRVDDAVLRAFAGDALEPEVITVIIDAVFAALEPGDVERNLVALKADLRGLDEKIKNLTLVSAQGGADIPSVVSLLREWHQEREALIEEIAAASAVNQIHADRAEVERKVQAQVAKWRALVSTAVVSDGRQLLNEMLEGPLRFTPEGKTYRFVGPVATGRMIAGMVFPPNVASPTGFEPVSWP